MVSAFNCVPTSANPAYHNPLRWTSFARYKTAAKSFYACSNPSLSLELIGTDGYRSPT